MINDKEDYIEKEQHKINKILMFLVSIFIIVPTYVLLCKFKEITNLDKIIYSYTLIGALLLGYGIVIENRGLIYFVHIYLTIFQLVSPFILDSKYSAGLYLLLFVVILVFYVINNLKCVVSYAAFDSLDNKPNKVWHDLTKEALLTNVLLALYVMRRVKWI